jgi:hypothetical protein
VCLAADPLQGLKKAVGAFKGEAQKWKTKFASTRQELIEVTEGETPGSHAPPPKAPNPVPYAAARWEMERQFEQTMARWKAQLEQRTRELEELQAKLSPQDMDMLRIKVQEELEGPHQQRVAALQGEVEQVRRATPSPTPSVGRNPLPSWRHWTGAGMGLLVLRA